VTFFSVLRLQHNQKPLFTLRIRWFKVYFTR